MACQLYASRLLFACLFSAAGLGGSATAQSRSIEGNIRSYECGDNCYLTVVDKARKVHTGLCTARECQSWNNEAEMPSRYKGKRVIVTVGQGTQIDGEGNIMGKMMAFSRIRFLD